MEIILKYRLSDQLVKKVLTGGLAPNKATKSAVHKDKQFVTLKMNSNSLPNYLETLVNRAYEAGYSASIQTRLKIEADMAQNAINYLETRENKGNSCEKEESGVNHPLIYADSKGVYCYSGRDEKQGDMVGGICAASVTGKLDEMEGYITKRLQNIREMREDLSGYEWGRGYSSALEFREDILNTLQDMVSAIRAELPPKDLFEDTGSLPQPVQDMIIQLGDSKLSPVMFEWFNKVLATYGYTCELSEDGTPYNLRELVD